MSISPAASQNNPVGNLKCLNGDVLGHIFSYSDPEALGRLEKVCKTLREIISSIGWKVQCETLDLPVNIDPAMSPEQKSALYKESVREVSGVVIGKRFYERYLGAKVDSVPLPSLRRMRERDLCDTAHTVGENYKLMYCPSHISITVPANSPWYLEKQDNLDDPVAPKLIQREASLLERFAGAIALGANQESRVLKVPVTINNLETLFKHHLKAGHPSKYSHIWSSIVEQYGDERIPAGYTWEREGVIGNDLTYPEQQALANGLGLDLSTLPRRILFNFLKHTQSNSYPDGQDPRTNTRTSTITHDEQGTPWPSGCGAGGPSGLHVYDFIIFDGDGVGVAVALPVEVRSVV